MTSGRGDTPFQVDPTATFLGDGVYMWLDMHGQLVIQRQPQFTGDENYWCIWLTPDDVDKVAQLGRGVEP